ncbi:ComEC/Rec2 family competence protein [Streptomyces sp. DSM 41014]|uniref:ComEC/Rec2 family competence protein n=1 Tax=Streptomyces hintoniae TaxID=3075521 RepID=A0ABU2UVI7_9ACTN|nr:ComEC/Rec2 family competence protein [Streptomyces sp. DSM 41014]MDT0477303.1 ComEC/Rec2 family competence protein [Streptomyces sp. DSM 41014]
MSGGAGPARERVSVHRTSGHRLGAAHPRQEEATDLRLVLPALGAWATTALLLDASVGWVVGVAGAGVVAATAVALLGRKGAGRGGGGGGGAGGGEGCAGGRIRRSREGWRRMSLVALLICVAAAAVAAGLHGADVRGGPVPEAARDFSTVTAEVEVTSDPRVSRPRISGDHMAPASVLVEGEARRLTKEDGTAVATRAPVLVIVDVGRVGRAAGAGAGAGVGAGDSSGGGGLPGASSDEGGRTPAGSGGDSLLRPASGGGGPPGAPSDRSTTTGGGGRVSSGSPWLALLPSTRVRVVGRLVPPMAGGDRIAGVIRVRGQAVPEVVAGASAVQRFAGRLRAGLREATDGLPGDARALLPGLVVGDTARILPDLEEAFKETDLAHTLAVSGSNLTIILALLIGPPGLAGLAERKGLAPRLGLSLRATALGGGVLTLAFVIVCRPDPSVLRAAACGAVELLALATGRRRSLVPALATAVLLLVLYDPWLARSYGFLLSVLATGALLTLAPRWSGALRRRGVPGRLAEALAAAGAAQALCAPVIAVLSARVSLVAVPCNLLGEFVVAPATVLGFAALATAPLLMPLAKVLAWGASWPAGWLAAIARTGAALPGAGVDWPGNWTGALLLAVATVAVLAVGRRLVRHPWGCGACAVLLVLAVVRPAPLTRVITGWPPPDWRFAMCDVGQGDATVLAAGAGSGVVVDAGPDPAAVDRCLRALGVTRVPLVVLTHFHADHVAGLPGVLRGRSVGAIQTTALEQPADQAEFVRREAAARHVPLVRAVAGEERRAGPSSWRVLWPPGGSAPVAESPNDASVALLVRVAGLRLLLLGDLEPLSQQALLRSPEGALLRGVDVLKVAHHGSAYQDPELIRRAAPRLALVSVGAGNSYGHPAPGTVAALRAAGAVVLRTDRDGALAITGRGDGLTVARG